MPYGPLKEQIASAVSEATRRSYLRPNAVDALTELNTGNNLGGAYFPVIHFLDNIENVLTIDLILKGGGCENVGAQYALPDRTLGATRDLEGVRRVALHAVQKAQGQGCAPGFLGIAIGGDRGSGYEASKAVLIRGLGDVNPEPSLAILESRIKEEANQLGIGPMGFGGRTTLLGVKITALHRLPASFFVSVSYMCWAYRHRRMTLSNGDVVYE